MTVIGGASDGKEVKIYAHGDKKEMLAIVEAILKHLKGDIKAKIAQ
jgi:hypothetical protein